MLVSGHSIFTQSFVSSRRSPMDASSPTNRFARHPLLTSLGILLFLIVVAECLSYVVIGVVGHRARRRSYPYNRVVSGYTVFRNTPQFNHGTSTIRLSADDPDATLDRFGFLTGKRITEEKGNDTIRVFLQGGSAAYGAGQNVNYHAVHTYPDGVYSYSISIAGQLQSMLAKQFPDRNIEVVNSASYARVYHQSLVQYLERLSRFEPDYVISFDGWNDISTFVHGRPYEDAEGLLPEFIELDRRARSLLNRSNTFYVLATAYDKLRVGRNRSTAAARAMQRDVSREAYQSQRDRFVKQAQRFEQIVGHYLAALEADGTRYIFVLQPMLTRADNKSLSSIEEELLAATLQGAWMDQDDLLVARYFFDDFLVPRLESLFAPHDALFIDGNREIADLDDSSEFFTDYCHLTVEGNRIIAQRISDHIEHLERSERRLQDDKALR
jgi:lysophospholipase L1-like esterase